jgi:hypothetical protein
MSDERPAGEKTVIEVKKPPASAFNKNRTVSSLIRAQLEHIQHAESARLPRHKRAGIRLDDIHTEAEAASYIATVTKALRPQRRKRSKPRTGS